MYFYLEIAMGSTSSLIVTARLILISSLHSEDDLANLTEYMN